MNDWDLLGVSLVIAALTGMLSAGFAGVVALRQLPQVHRLVNRNFTEQKEEIARLREEVNSLKDTALTKSEAREAPPPRGPGE